MQNWPDTIAAEEGAKNPFFKKVRESQRQYASLAHGRLLDRVFSFRSDGTRAASSTPTRDEFRWDAFRASRNGGEIVAVRRPCRTIRKRHVGGSNPPRPTNQSRL